MKKLLKRLIFSIIPIVCLTSLYSQTYVDSLYITFGNGTDVDTFKGVGYTAPVSYGKYTVDPYSNWYSNSAGTIDGGYPSAVGSSYIYKTSGGGISNINVNISGFTENFAHVYLGIGSSSTDYNTSNYISVNGNPVDTVNPYNNTDPIYLGAFSLDNNEIIITITSANGYACMNSLVLHTLDSVPPSYNYQGVSDTLVINPIASEATKSLYNELKYNYGKKIYLGWTGQSSDGGTNAYWRAYDSIGVEPKIYDIDMNTLTVGFGYKYNSGCSCHTFGYWDNNQIDSAIAHYNQGQIVMAHWHWYAPSGGHGLTNLVGARGEVSATGTFSTGATNYDIATALNPATEDYDWLIEDIDSVANALKILRDADIPVLWRPLHEAAGGWFWWGAGTKQNYIDLWDTLFNRFTYYHNLDNLIWVVGQAFPQNNWYPNSNQFDINGVDWYPNLGTENDTSQEVPTVYMNILRNQVNDKKMICLPEVGPFPNVDSLFFYDKIPILEIGWANESVAQFNSRSWLQTVFNHDSVITKNTLYYTAYVKQYVDSAKINFNGGGFVSGWNNIGTSETTTVLNNGWRIYSSSADSYTTAGYIPNIYEDLVSQTAHYASASSNSLVDTLKGLDVQHYFDINLLLSRGNVGSTRYNKVVVKGLTSDSTTIDINNNTTLIQFTNMRPASDSTITFIIDTINGASYKYRNALVVYESDSIYLPETQYCDTAPVMIIGTTIVPDTVINSVNQGTGSITLGITNGISPYTFAWDDGPTTQNRTGLTPGTYRVTVTDDSSCVKSKDNIIVGVYDPCDSTIISSTSVSIVADTIKFSTSQLNGSITISTTGGKVPYTYLWSNSASTQNISSLSGGQYIITVTDNNYCTGVDTFIVDTYNPCDTTTITLSAEVTHVTDESLGSIVLTINGGKTPYTYLWNSSDISKDISNISYGLYSVTTTDNNGCTKNGQWQVLNQTTGTTTKVGPTIIIDIIVNPGCIDL